VRRVIRNLFAGALALVLVGGSLNLAVLPAAAEEPTPPPTVEPTPEPTDSEPEPTEPEPAPEPEPTAAEKPEPTATPEPTDISAVTPGTGTVEYTGTLNRLAAHVEGDEHGAETPTAMLYVAGRGYLAVDTTGWSESDLQGRITLTLAVPSAVTQSGDAAADFTALSTAAAKSDLEILGARPGRVTFERETSALVNQTPTSTATHRVYVVLVSPNGVSTTSSQRPTTANVAASVAHADDYWSEQSSDVVGFEVAGTVPWYMSTYSCKTISGSTSLWNQAAAKAATSLGYAAGKNNHLVLVFPSNTDCAGTLGLATIGWSANEGGLVWVIGDGSGLGDPDFGKMEKGTLAHELGHNLSLGHASWLECSSSQPDPGFTGLNGCTRHDYGDMVDVMGYADPGLDGGALSSAQAIRANLWPSSAWTTAPQGTNSYVLNDVALNSGLRSVVVQDSNGVNYFIEYRNFQDEDAQYVGYGCYPDACVAGTAGVRVLRLENTDFDPTDPNVTGMLGFPGDDSFLIGRTVSGVDKVNYTATQVWRSQGASGLQMTVDSLTATTATITIVKGADSTVNTTDQFWIMPTLTSTSTGMGVGDTWTAFVGDSWEAQSTTINWYRGNTPTTVTTLVASGQNYTLGIDDLGKYIGARLVGQNPGGSTVTRYDPAIDGGYGPISAGIYGVDDPGAVQIDNSTTPLVALKFDYPAGTTYTYQWYRGASATTATTLATGSGSTTGSYTPNSADYNQFLRVKVTATIPGYTNKPVRYSPAMNYSIFSSSTIAITGTGKVGSELAVDTSGITYTTVNGSLSGVTKQYQWLRDGVAIPGATSDGYVLTSADYLKKISLRVTNVKAGWVSKVITTPTLTVSQKGTIWAPSPAVTMLRDVDKPGELYSFKLTASVTGVFETGTSAAYQWYRVNRTTLASTAITGAVSSVYRPTAADFAYELKVRVILTKSNYDSLTLYALPKDYSIRLNTAVNPYGWTDTTLSVGDTAVPLTPEFTIEEDNGDITALALSSADIHAFTYYRTGIKITGATGPTYPVVSADVGKTLSFRLDVREDGWLPIVQAVSPNTAAVTLASLASVSTPQITQTGLTLTVGSMSSTPAATSYTYQWYRNGVAVTGKTTATYVLTSADFGKDITVKVTYKRAGYQNAVRQADSGGNGTWWISADTTVPVITGDIHVGGTLGIASRTYTNVKTGATLDVGTSVIETYQWYRSGIAISAASGGTASTYTLTSLDKGKAMTVRVLATDPTGLVLSNTSTSAGTQLVGTNLIAGTSIAAVTVAKTTTTDFATTLKATVTGISETGVTYKYQWYRAGVAVTGATASTYKLSAADKGKQVWVRVIVSKAASGATTYTTVVLYSARIDYTLTAPTTGLTLVTYDPVTSTEPKVGQRAVAPFVQLQYGGVDVNNADVRQRWQWYRNGVAITGATASTYKITTADLGLKLTVRITSDLAGGGYVPNVTTYTTSPATVTVKKGDLQGANVAPVVSINPATNTLLAMPGAVTGVSAAGDTPPPATLTYQWLRNGVAITGATAISYKLTSADWGKNVNVRVTASRSGYTTAVLPLSTPVDYSIRPDTGGTPPYVSGNNWRVGEQVGVYGLNFVTKDGALGSPTIAYQWTRGGVAIPGATSSNYGLVAADYNQIITVRLTVSTPGYVTLVHSPVGVKAVKGVTVGTPVVEVVPAGAGVLKAQLEAGTLVPATPVPTFTYQWYRDNLADATPAAAITGATLATYKLTSADTGRAISVKVTMTRTNFTVPVTAFARTTGVDYTIRSTGALPTIDGTPAVGQMLSATPPVYFEADGTTPIGTSPTLTYTWYRSGIAIPGATFAGYTLTASDLAKKITVKVTATLPGRLAHTSGLSASSATVVAGTIDVGSVAVQTTSNSAVFPKVTASVTGSSVTSGPFTYTYQWYRDNPADATAPAAITGATTSSYILTSADTGKEVSVVVTMKKTAYISHVFTEVIANQVTYGEPPVITGTPAVGQELSGEPPPFYLASGIQTTAFTLQWLRDGDPIAGATGYNYTVVAEDMGADLTFRVTLGAALHAPLVVTTDPVTISP
jgi:hypothetical protein